VQQESVNCCVYKIAAWKMYNIKSGTTFPFLRGIRLYCYTRTSLKNVIMRINICNSFFRPFSSLNCSSTHTLSLSSLLRHNIFSLQHAYRVNYSTVFFVPHFHYVLYTPFPPFPPTFFLPPFCSSYLLFFSISPFLSL
jgi:hypothetical protein